MLVFLMVSLTNKTIHISIMAIFFGWRSISNDGMKYIRQQPFQNFFLGGRGAMFFVVVFFLFAMANFFLEKNELCGKMPKNKFSISMKNFGKIWIFSVQEKSWFTHPGEKAEHHISKELNGQSLKVIYVVNNVNFSWWSKWLGRYKYILTNEDNFVKFYTQTMSLLIFFHFRSQRPWGGLICGQQFYRIFMIISNNHWLTYICGRRSINSCQLECVTIDHMDFTSISNSEILFGKLYHRYLFID